MENSQNDSRRSPLQAILGESIGETMLNVEPALIFKGLLQNRQVVEVSLEVYKCCFHQLELVESRCNWFLGRKDGKGLFLFWKHDDSFLARAINSDEERELGVAFDRNSRRPYSFTLME